MAKSKSTAKPKSKKSAKNGSKKGLSKREWGLMGLVALVLIFGFFKYWYGPKNQEIKEIEGKISAPENELRTQQLTIESSKKRLIASDDVSSHPLKKYVDQNAMLANLVQILTQPKDYDMFKIKKMSSERPVAFQNYQKARFTLDVETSYLAVGSFLEMLEQSNLLTEVQSVEIRRVDEDLKKVTAQIKLNGYFHRE